MKRALLVFLFGALVVAPAASAKGPHAVLTTPRETVEAGRPWEVTVELNEFRRAPVPALIARSGARTVGAEVERTPASIDGATGFRFTMTFPRDGRWKLWVFAGKKRFSFPAVDVGGAAMPQNYVAFPVGSEAARAGGNAVWTTDEAPADGGQTPTSDRSQTKGSDPSEDGRISPWWLALAGVALLALVTRRGSRRPRRPRTGAPRQPSEG
jgi:hypothetical protein